MKAILIYNPVSGKQKFYDYLPLIEDKIKTKYEILDIVSTTGPEHAVEIAKDACENRYDLLIISGGDGTFNECINGVMSHDYKPSIGYIPSGTTCDIGMSLGLSKNIKKALNIILEGHPVKMDVVKTNDRYSCYVTGTGAFIDISYVTDSSLKKRIGHLAYMLKGIQEFFSIPKMRMTVYHDHGKVSGVYSLMLIINSKRVAGLNMVYKPELDDGKVDVVMFRSFTPLNPILYAIYFLFPFWSTPLIEKYKTHKLEVRTNSDESWNIDGEYGGKGNKIVRVIKQAITIHVPKKVKDRYFINQ
ncbi:MAG TPA: diacylglycerol kinase family protein [Candidatus Izemoplasmatales bacterium]|nr:diacylglycerol kinase family protein [Candidatus Izemoplasmatales bacterium]